MGKEYYRPKNGEINKYIFEEDLNQYLSSGWKLGQLPRDRSESIKKFKETHYSKENLAWKNNIRNSIKGRKWVTNGSIDKQVKLNEVDFYLRNGFRLGRCKARG